MMNSSGGMIGTKNRRFSLLLLAGGSAEAFSGFFMCAPARAIIRRVCAHVKSINMLPCFRKGGFSPVNIGPNQRKHIFQLLPLLPHGFRIIGGLA